MFHMTKTIYDKTIELGKLLAESEEFLTLKKLEDEGEKDPELSACVANYIEKRQQLEQETLKDDKDFDLISALTREIDEEYQRMRTIPVYAALQKARNDYNALMAAINEVLQAALYPESTGCSGDCASCGGCSGHHNAE